MSGSSPNFDDANHAPPIRPNPVITSSATNSTSYSVQSLRTSAR